MDQEGKCMIHGLVTEIYCRSCKSYICVACLTTHTKDGHSPNYVHIITYSKEVVFPRIDQLLKDICGKDSEFNFEISEFVSGLGSVTAPMKEAVHVLAQTTTELEKLVQRLGLAVRQFEPQSFTKCLKAGIARDKHQLEHAYKSGNVRLVVELTRKIQAEANIPLSTPSDRLLTTTVKEKVSLLNDISTYQELTEVMQFFLTKCQHLRLSHSGTTWACDRTYLTSNMYLSDDGLTIGNRVRAEPTGMIGTLVFNTGMFAFEVTPSGMSNRGKEGFGIIELNTFLAAVRSNKFGPVVTKDIIGLLFSNTPKNMIIVAGNEMRMNETYLVKVDLVGLQMTLTGPGASLKVNLKPDVAYVPCFLCCAATSKMVIKPIDYPTDD